MSPPTPARSTAEAQRARVLTSAVRVFARTGYHATPVTDIATDAGISPAYVFRLFPGKLALFTAAVEHCYEATGTALAAGAARVPAGAPAERLAAMADAYAELVADEDLLLLQVHAQAAAQVPAVGAAVRRGLAGLVALAQRLSGADDAAVQHFFAHGQLCHLIATAGLDDVDTAWAHTLTAGLRHVGRPAA